MRQILLWVFAAGLMWGQGDPRIRTLAGNGVFERPSIGALAEGSPMVGALAVAFDSQGRTYATLVSGELWRIDSSGRWERLWVSPAGALLFGLAVDSSGQAYVSDLLTHRVIRVAADGTSSVVAAELDSPVGLALDAAGNLYISERGRIRVLDAEGRIRTYTRSQGHGSLAIDSKGNLYLADFAAGALTRIAPDLTESVAFEGTPLAVAICPGDRVHWTDMYRVLRQGEQGAEVLAGSSERAFAGESGPAREARFVTPLALACDSAGRVVVSDASSARLRLIE